MCRVAILLLRRGSFFVDQARRVQAQREAAFDNRLLSQQHPPHIGVFDDHHLAGLRIALIGMAALRALRRIREGVPVTGVGHGDRSQSDLEASLIHHVKHLRETAIRLADELTDTLATCTEIQQAGDDAPGTL